MTTTAGLCDTDSGVCALPGAVEEQGPQQHAAPAPQERPVRITYVTDPICSACWVSEPAWRSVTARYADVLDIVHVYGGLLPSWDGFLDAGAGIRQPSDVAHHWDEFSAMTGQPIDASVWLTDPLPSSFPASIAAVAVRLVSPEREAEFLRRIREALFLDARNIARPEVLAQAAAALGVDMPAYAAVLADGSAEQQFRHDRAQSRALGVRGFPTLFVEGAGGRLVVHGIFNPGQLERAVLAVSGMERRPQLAGIEAAVALLGVGTSAEYEATLGWDTVATEQALAAAGMTRVDVGGGAVWRR